MLYAYGMSQKHHVLPLTVALLFGCGGPDEETEPGPTSKPVQEKAKPEPRKELSRPQAPADAPAVVFRRDRGIVVARVNGQDIKLEDIIRHIDRHSYKDYLKLAERGDLDYTLSSPEFLPRWVRLFADRRALELVAKKRKLDPALVNKERKDLATKGFLEFLENYKRTYKAREGRDYPENPRSVASLRRGYLLKNGLDLECQAWLNVLVPDSLSQEQADWYLRTQPQVFNGYLDISVITIHNRDPKTGALYKGMGKTGVTKKIHEIKSRLEEDGSNFEEIAARFSDVARERRRAGEYSNINRLDPRLPASICRTAWGLRNGKWKGPVESAFGLHFIKRIRYHSKNMVVRLKPDVPEVRRFIRKLRQEDQVFKARREQNVELLY